MIKRPLSVIAGIVTGFIVVGISDKFSEVLYPAAAVVNYKDKKALEVFIAGLPFMKLFIMFCGWILSSFAGGLVTVLIETENSRKRVILVGALLMTGAIMNMLYIPHPVWMTVGSIVLYIPAAIMGGLVAGKIKSKKEISVS